MTPISAFTPTGAYLGTDRIARALTGEERDRLERMLREHGYLRAKLAALAFATKLARNPGRADELVSRMNLRLVCQGWDPERVTLKQAMVRFVWSEHTHEKQETDAAKRAEERFLREHEATGQPRPAAPTRGDPLLATREPFVPSVEAQLLELGLERRDEARAARRMALHTAVYAELRKRLDAKKDHANVVILDEMERGNDDLAVVASRSGFTPEELYAAQKRRKRLVKSLLAEARGDLDVDANDDDDE